MFKLLAFLIFFVGCTGMNNHHTSVKNFKDGESSVYLSMSKARYEEIYHNTQRSKYHLKNSNQINEHTDPLDSLDLIWPASGVLTSAFGVRTLRHRTQMHTGIDIAAQVGTPVYASETGRVVFDGTKKGYGKVIMVRHDKTHETLYGHLSRSIVKINEIVHRNQLIGYVGKTGRVTGANLHFETRVNGVAKDPLHFLPGSYDGKRRIYVGELIVTHPKHHIVSITHRRNKKI